MVKRMDHVLVIDDDVELCSLVQEYLTAEGFSLKAVHDGEQGLQQALTNNYALVVLDVMLPGINGFEVLRRIRSVSKIPVLLLTARGEDVDRIVGLEIGADDYLRLVLKKTAWYSFIHPMRIGALVANGDDQNLAPRTKCPKC